ncbi:E3 ubiquitin-protein ligase RNF25 isoform X2 [Electrophorus electricus]|nr:E3 ubiquitin-protein ligase RNF25 isoform X2 [Electrophorus electricus]
MGMPVLYQLIEKAKEILTESNIPHGNCVICLYGFKEGEIFTKTSCYHYFHSHCLGRYVTHSEVELRERERELEEDKSRNRVEDEEELFVVCPVCREPLTYDANTLLSSAAPNFPQQDDEAVRAEFKRKWANFQKILERQKEKGGVIDPEAESNRFLIHINDAPADCSDPLCYDATSSEPSESAGPAQNPTPAPRAELTCASSLRQSSHGSWYHRGLRGGRRRRGRGRGRHTPHGASPTKSDDLAEPRPSSAGSNHVEDGLSARNNGSHIERIGPLVELGVNRDQISQSVKPEQEDCVATQQEPSVSKQEQPICQSNSNISDDGARVILTDGQQERSPQDRGRRHGPLVAQHGQRHERNPPDSTQWHGAGTIYQHGGGRGYRARAGGFANPHRGGGPQRGGRPLRGTGKGVYQKTDGEFRKEGLL